MILRGIERSQMIWLQHHQCLKKKEGRKEDDESERWESRYNMKKRAKSEVYTDGLFLSLSLSFSAKVYCMYYGWITCALEEDDDERGRDDVASSWKERTRNTSSIGSLFFSSSALVSPAVHLLLLFMQENPCRDQTFEASKDMNCTDWTKNNTVHPLKQVMMLLPSLSLSFHFTFSASWWWWWSLDSLSLSLLVLKLVKDYRFARISCNHKVSSENRLYSCTFTCEVSVLYVAWDADLVSCKYNLG